MYRGCTAEIVAYGTFFPGDIFRKVIDWLDTSHSLLVKTWSRLLKMNLVMLCVKKFIGNNIVG